MVDTWDGRPPGEAAERDGWHWVRCAVAPAYEPEPMYWHVASGEFIVDDRDDGWWPQDYEYLGPCLTPAHAAAAALAEREACAAVAATEKSRLWQLQQNLPAAPTDVVAGNRTERLRDAIAARAGTASEIEAAIRARPAPEGADALAAAEKAAYRQGWNDREADFLAGVERTGMAVVSPDALRQARAEGMRRAAEVARKVGRPVGAGDNDTYVPGTSADAAAAILAAAEAEERAPQETVHLTPEQRDVMRAALRRSVRIVGEKPDAD